MRILLALLLLAPPAYAQGYDEYGNDHLKGIRGTLNMGQAYQWGKLQNQLAAEAPPERKQIEIINRNPAPNYYFGSAPAVPVAPARNYPLPSSMEILGGALNTTSEPQSPQ